MPCMLAVAGRALPTCCQASSRQHGLRLHGLRLHGLRLHGLRLHGLRLHGLRLHGLRSAAAVSMVLYEITRQDLIA